MFGKRKNEVFDMEKFKQSLSNTGYSSEQITNISSEVSDIIDDAVQEKTHMNYEEFVTSVEDKVHGLNVLPSNRMEACKEVERFIKENPEVNNSIKLYASYIAYGAAEIKLEEYKVMLTGDEEDVEQARNYVNIWEQRSKIQRKIYQLARDIVPYGDAFLEKIYSDGLLTGVSYIPSRTMLPRLNSQGHPLKFYQIIDQKAHFADEEAIYKALADEDKKVIAFDIKEIAHFSDGSIVGVTDTPLYNLIILWKFMKMLEEALLIHKMTRARRFIIFFLDVTEKSKKDIRSAMNAFTTRIKSVFRLDLRKGEMLTDKSTIPSSSDLVIPVTKESKTRVQNVPADSSATKIDDLRFYLNRLTTNLLTAHIFNNDVKTGKEEVIEKAFMRLVRIYQRQMEYTLEDLYRELLDQGDYLDVGVKIMFPAPDSKQEIKIVDVIVRRMMIINQLTATLQVSPPVHWVINYVFRDLTQFEVNDLVKLLEEEIQIQADAAAEEEEYKSVFDDDLDEEEEEESTAFESALHGDDIPLDALLNKATKNTRAKKPNVVDYSSAIKLSMEYLKLQKDLE